MYICSNCQAVGPCGCIGRIVPGDIIPLPACQPPFDCNCEQTPCVCFHGHTVDLEEDINTNKNCCTLCSGDRTNNIWFQPGPPGYPGRCILDELTYGQVYMVLIRNPDAKKDLLRITNYPVLLELARQSQLIKDPIEDDKRATDLINKGNTLPFYTQFRGNLDGSIR